MKSINPVKIFLPFFLLIISISTIKSQNIKSKIDNLVKKTYTEDGPGIAIIIEKNGTTYYKKTFGKSNLELNKNISTETVFQIGSLTKQFTAVAILMLEEEGKLNLNDNILKYFPDYPTNGNDITIHNLLNHTSGISGRTPVSNKKLRTMGMKAEDLIEYIKKQPLKFNSGDQFSYSNSGYILLGRIVEIITGVSYETFIENIFFKKLKMNNSRYGDDKEIIHNIASGYQFNGQEYVNAPNISMSLFYSAGAILSTVDDLLKWQKALISGQLINQTNYLKATSGSNLNNGVRIPYGYGWRVRKINNSNAIVHGGATSGFMSTSIYLKAEKVSIIALTNCYCKEQKDLQKVTFKIASLLTTTSAVKNIDKVELSKKELTEWIGNYQLNNNTYITITLINDSLYGYNSNKKNIKHRLVPLSTTNFTFENKKLNFQFMISENGEKKLKMSSGNRELYGIKID